jgi:hypothetical protein
MTTKLENAGEKEYTTISVSKDFHQKMKANIPKSYSFEAYLMENLEFTGGKNE